MTNFSDIFFPGLAIGFVVGLLIGLPIAFIPWTKRQKRTLHLIQENHLEAHFPVRYCTEKRYRKWFKFFPWEGIGFVRREGSLVEFNGFPNHGQPFRVEVSHRSVQDHGRPNWFRNGVLPWLMLENEAGKIYFVSESGPFVFGARFQNKVLLNHLTQGTEQGGNAT